MVLQAWNPYRELRRMEDTMNRLWRGFGGVPGQLEGAEDWNILVDVIQQQDNLVVVASLPGVNPDEIDISVEDNVLRLRAERKPEAESEKSRYMIRERPVGSFFRALRLPETVDTDKIESYYENGVLNITLPKAEEKKKKQIKVKVGSGPKIIEGTGKK
ncbi:MAG: Hsp20/alpha crystallin family protein [Dehalococcoidia bacterium]|nr:MAG: Hsp20/alpha crystallin family protein [Dehalococcoidia bacterium]